MVHRRFENISLIPLNAGIFKRGAAVTIPGLGIITGNAGIKNHDLLRHEFGHILQFRKWGFLFYWFRIAPDSVLSARKAIKSKTYNHMDCWTEWSANLLSYQYFNKPSDWNFTRFPIGPPAGVVTSLPEFLRKEINGTEQA
jgi:hypothetical protein